VTGIHDGEMGITARTGASLVNDRVKSRIVDMKITEIFAVLAYLAPLIEGHGYLTIPSSRTRQGAEVSLP